MKDDIKDSTPRTDAAQFGTGQVSASFARTLERELTAKDTELSELRGMYEGMKDCQKNANEAAREFADAATRAESERDELRVALTDERAHADRLAEALKEVATYACPIRDPLGIDGGDLKASDNKLGTLRRTAQTALTAHEARRQPNTEPSDRP